VSAAVRQRRKRFRFSLNGLAIQLSAFALSFTLVALLVVSGSQAAFVEQNEVVTQYVPIGTPVPTEGGTRHGQQPTTAAPPASTVTESPAVPEPEPEVDPEPVPEVPATEVRLTDNAAGTALFGNELLRPGMPVQRCIAVTYTGTVDPEAVRLYAAATSGGLAPYLDLTIDIGRPGTPASTGCAGFTPAATVYVGTLAAFAADHASFATGRPTWDPADGEETRSFRFSLLVRADPAASGRTATFGFSWRTEAA
jgi:hypothetical protein